MKIKLFLLLTGFLLNNVILKSQEKYNLRVDSLFSHHINSLKSNLKDGMVIKKEVSEDNRLFLEFFYYLSGKQIAERDHFYGTLPLYIKPSEIKEAENWYYCKQSKITWDNVKKIYCLMRKMKSVKAENFEELESSHNEINNELEKLRIN